VDFHRHQLREISVHGGSHLINVHGCPWVSMGVHGIPCPWAALYPPMSMDAHGCLWKFTEVHGCPWNSMPMGSFVSINVHGSPWKSIDAHGCSWKSIDAHRCPWMPISVHQYQVPFLKRPQEAPSFGCAPLPAPSLGCPSGSCMGYGPYYDEYTYVKRKTKPKFSGTTSCMLLTHVKQSELSDP